MNNSTLSMKGFLILVCFWMLGISTSVGQPMDAIAQQIQTGNARELARFFDNSVEITVNDKEDIYSKAQAEMILRDFFAKNPPRSFRILHKGNSTQGSEYGIGSYITEDSSSYRTYIYLKQKTGGFFIQEIRFERD